MAKVEIEAREKESWGVIICPVVRLEGKNSKVQVEEEEAHQRGDEEETLRYQRTSE